MMHFDTQAVKDLEFDLIRLMLHDFCVQPTARLRMIDLEPLRDHRKLKIELQRVHEFFQIRSNGIAFPALDFEELDQEIKILQLRESVLNEESFSGGNRRRAVHAKARPRCRCCFRGGQPRPKA
ncbi:MAG: hypothetical protein ACKOZM_05980, partial [Flavobacteriales bacterium]